VPVDTVPKKPLDFNEVDWGFTTARLGMAVINDWAWYSQDTKGKAQMDSANIVLPDYDAAIRDVRFFGSGKINTKRYMVWKAAIMYDGALREWTFRETGLLMGLPELSSKVFIGRSKEGYSLNKVQNGYSCPAIERQPSLDLIPIMTDGIRIYGDSKKTNLFWSAGAFTNAIYGHSKFMLWQYTYSGRFGWLPIYKPTENKILHIGFSGRYARPDQDKIDVKSRPESNPAPYFIQTGSFDCNKSTAVGGELYYFNGPLMIGSEANYYSFQSVQAGNPNFYGANILFTYNLTGESYPYIKDNATSFFIKPNKSFFDHGPGAWQVLLTGTVFNTNDGLKQGGEFWKGTAMINWYLSQNFTMKFVYGYGVLDRFHTQGATQFFQYRLQFQFM
jgi:phosphate-selective porin OprO/OprP